MDETDSRRFFTSLNYMAEMFSDTMSELKQRGYWNLLHPRLTIEEWEYACTQAMTRETFHKVPLPAILIDYAMEHRQAARAAEEAEHRHALEASRREAQAVRRALEASPEWQAEQKEQRAREQQDRADYEAWLATLPRAVKITLGLINPPNPKRWRPLGEDDLLYVPTEDPEHAKGRLRAQFQKLLEENIGKEDAP